MAIETLKFHPMNASGRFALESVAAVAAPLDEVFSFFGNAENLERLTPEALRFEILTPTPIAMAAGTLIDYRIRMRGIPMRWRTLIEAWEPPHRFVDVQLRGPYLEWHHEHRFEEIPGGTLVRDLVHYRVLFPRLVHKWLVRPELRGIFGYRAAAMAELFGTLEWTGDPGWDAVEEKPHERVAL